MGFVSETGVSEHEEHYRRRAGHSFFERLFESPHGCARRSWIFLVSTKSPAGCGPHRHHHRLPSDIECSGQR